MQSVDVLNKKVFEKARQMPDLMPEMFTALEEYDKTRTLKKWSNKIRVNFTLDPTVFEKFKAYCNKEGYKMSTVVERLIKKTVK